VLPLLQALRWAIFDPNCDLREYTLGSKRVDYPFSSSPPKKEIFIEVKALGQSVVGADRQLFEYAFHEGIPFAILTDGREWNFFLPGEQGLYDILRTFVIRIFLCDWHQLFEGEQEIIFLDLELTSIRKSQI
jgi:predicted type IV restriction endonuclease